MWLIPAHCILFGISVCEIASGTPLCRCGLSTHLPPHSFVSKLRIREPPSFRSHMVHNAQKLNACWSPSVHKNGSLQLHTHYKMLPWNGRANKPISGLRKMIHSLESKTSVELAPHGRACRVPFWCDTMGHDRLHASVVPHDLDSYCLRRCTLMDKTD